MKFAEAYRNNAIITVLLRCAGLMLEFLDLSFHGASYADIPAGIPCGMRES